MIRCSGGQGLAEAEVALKAVCDVDSRGTCSLAIAGTDDAEADVPSANAARAFRLKAAELRLAIDHRDASAVKLAFDCLQAIVDAPIDLFGVIPRTIIAPPSLPSQPCLP